MDQKNMTLLDELYNEILDLQEKLYCLDLSYDEKLQSIKDEIVKDKTDVDLILKRLSKFQFKKKDK